MTVKLPIDELNVLTEDIAQLQAADLLTPDRAVDIVLDLLVMAYVYGIDAFNADFGTSIEPNTDEMIRSVYKPIAGETFEQRVRQYAGDGKVYDIARVADTEMHRVYNEGAFYAAQQSGLNLEKRWATMLDDRVRDTHYYLEGVTVPMNAYFYTYDGDSALYPGGFIYPQNNVNCRCVIEYIRV